MTIAKRVKRQSSKPIIGWLQKKLGGSGRATRAPPPPANERPRTSSLQLQIPRNNDKSHVVLNDEEDLRIGRSTPPRSSRSSTWSPTTYEADDDASIRPLPPTSPPSPAPSRSSSSYLSDPRTFKSVTVSTKPTTLLSVDLGTNGMAHIAQAPPTPTSFSTPQSPVPRFSTSTSNSASIPATTSISFSALPLMSSTSRSESRSPGPGNVQAPLHTSHHPRYNPRPSSPPQDNASVLTLASSAFAFPGGRMGGWVGDSQSQFAIDNNSQQGELDMMPDEGQVENASVRALRPRSSRRGSWESETSLWSAKVAIVRERSLKANSWKTSPLTDGDGSAEITGEESEEVVRAMHGPSPLSANGFTTPGSLPAGAGEETLTREPQDIQEGAVFATSAEVQDDHPEPNSSPAYEFEAERTPRKNDLDKSNYAEDFEEETQKIPAKDQPTALVGLEKDGRLSTEYAEVVTG